MSMANEKNLRPLNTRSQRNSENGRKSEQSGAEEQKITQRSG